MGEINIYSSPEDICCGNADFYLDSEINIYGGNEYIGEIVQTDDSTYHILTEDDISIYYIASYQVEYNAIMIDLYIEDELVEQYMMTQHFES